MVAMYNPAACYRPHRFFFGASVLEAVAKPARRSREDWTYDLRDFHASLSRTVHLSHLPRAPGRGPPYAPVRSHRTM